MAEELDRLVGILPSKLADRLIDLESSFCRYSPGSGCEGNRFANSFVLNLDRPMSNSMRFSIARIARLEKSLGPVGLCILASTARSRLRFSIDNLAAWTLLGHLWIP